jgi:D-alanine-D-alanine ligase
LKVELAEEQYAVCPADLPVDIADSLARLAAAVFRVTGCTDVARIDFRLDEDDSNTPLILEVNPLPGLNKKYSDLCLEAYAAGMSFEDLIGRIVDAAAARYQLRDRVPGNGRGRRRRAAAAERSTSASR